MAIDASEILTAWMQGSRFVSENLDRAEQRRQAQEDERMQEVATRYLANTGPRFVNGKLIPPDWSAAFNDEGVRAVINEYAGDILNKGLPEGVRFEFQGVKTITDEQGNPKVVPVGRQFGADGKPLSPAGVPATQGRTSQGNDPVVALSLDQANTVFMSAVARRNPKMSQAMMQQQTAQAYSAALTALRTAKDPNEIAQIADSTAQYFGVPHKKLADDAGRIQIVENPVDGTVTSRDPLLNTQTTVYDPRVAQAGDPIVARQTQQEVKRQGGLMEGRLTFEEQNLPRTTGVSNRTFAATYPTQQGIQARTANDLAGLNGGARGKEAVAADQVTTPYEQGRTMTQRSEEYQALRNAVTQPSPANDRALLKFYKPEDIANAKAQFATDTLGPQVFANPDRAQAVTDSTALYAGTADPTARKRLRGMAVNALASPNPEEQALGWETLHRFDLVDSGASAFGRNSGTSQKVEMPKFHPDEAKPFANATGKLTDQQEAEAGVELRRTFDSTLQTLASSGVPAATLKQTEGDLNRAVALDYRLRSTEGVSNTAPTLYVAMQLGKRYNVKNLTEEDLALRIVGPLKKELEERGGEVAPRVLFESVEDVYRLTNAGVSVDRAVDEASKLADPKYTQGMLVMLEKKYPKEIAAAKDAANRGQQSAVLDTIATLRARSIKEEPGINQRGGDLIRRHAPAYAKIVEDMYGWGKKGLSVSADAARRLRLVPGGESPDGLMEAGPNSIVDRINP